MRHNPRHLMLATALLTAAIAGCGDDDEPSVPAPDASAYAAALSHVIPAAPPDEQPNVFVAPFDEPLALEDQVAVIDMIGDGFDVKFVDDPATAVDADSIGRPAVDDGLLIVLGTIPPQPPYVVRLESYRREDDVSARLVTLVWRTDHWDVAAEERVDPEAVILDE